MRDEGSASGAPAKREREKKKESERVTKEMGQRLAYPE